MIPKPSGSDSVMGSTAPIRDDLYSELTPFSPILILGGELTIMGLYETVGEGSPDSTFRYFA